MYNDVTSDDFKHAMRGVASTVHVVTMFADGRSLGMTATAVSSLSVDPPSLLVCMNRSASMHSAMLEEEHFCVNVLSHGQSDVARRFSDGTLRESRFESGDWSFEGHLAPRLIGAQASLICRRLTSVEHGTHTIFTGEVTDVALGDTNEPLIYLNRTYRRLG